MAKKIDTVLRDELVALLNGGNAHMGFDDAIAGFPIKAINDKPPHVNYTFWHLLEHMRRAQYDILKFMGIRIMSLPIIRISGQRLRWR